MAYGAKKISTLDLYPSKGIGVKIPFSNNSVFTTVYTTKEQLKYNLINFILTDKRERPFNPRFGLNLRSKLFEAITNDTAEIIQSSIRSQVEANFPNVNLEEVTVTSDQSDNSIRIKFSYSIKSTSETDTAVIAIQNP